MIRLGLADDHQLFREGLASLLGSEEDIEIIVSTSEALTIYETLKNTHLDVVLLDINMPKVDGFDLAETLLADFPDVRVIFLTARFDPAATSRALEVGASGFVLKDDAFDDLVRAIHQVRAGERFLSSSLDSGNAASLSQLSPRESEVLRLIAQGLQNKEIADRLHISLTTVRTHRARLMEKLSIHSGPELVRFAIEHGLI